MAKSSDKREIVRGWEPGARVAGKHRRLRPFGTPHPIVGAIARFVCCFLTEHLPPSLGISVARSELIDFLDVFKSSGIMFILL